MNNNDYVTHREFESTMQNLDLRFDEINRRFTETNNRIGRLTTALYWIAGIMCSGIILPLLLFVIKALFFTK